MESNQNNISDNISINSNIVSNLNRIYESYGRDKQSWLYLLSLTNKSNSLLLVIYFFNQKIMNQPSNPITLDIIDFLIDFGNIKVLREISNIGFMKNIFNLLKKSSGSSPEVQKKGIYLIGKWKGKCNEFPNENFAGFINNFNELYNHNISLPPPGFKIVTYENYINQYDVNMFMNNEGQNQGFNNNFNNIQQNNINNNGNNKFNNNYGNNNNQNNSFQYQSKYSFNRNSDINNNMNNINSINNNIENNNDNRINTLPEFPKELFDNINNTNNKQQEGNNNINNNINKDSEMFMKPHLKEGININKIEENENKNVYPIYEENKNNENKNNYEQNNDFQLLNNEKTTNDNQDMDVPPPVINNEGKDLFSAPLINNIVQTPLGNTNKMNEPNKNNKSNSIYNIDDEFRKIENQNNNNYNNNNNYANRSHIIINQKNNLYNDMGFNNKNNIYNDISNNFNNNNNFNNSMYQCKNDLSQNIISYKMNWIDKINLCNHLMNQGYSDNTKERTKEIIKEILYELEHIQNLLFNNNRKVDQETILKIKSDMNQTCHRYEKFINNQSYERFVSAFDGNECIYTFNRDNLLLYQNQNQNQNNYNNNYNQ